MYSPSVSFYFTGTVKVVLDHDLNELKKCFNNQWKVHRKKKDPNFTEVTFRFMNTRNL